MYRAPIACENETQVDFSWRELCPSCKYVHLVSTCGEQSQLSSNPLLSCEVTRRVRAAGEGLHESCSGLLSAGLGTACCY